MVRQAWLQLAIGAAVLAILLLGFAFVGGKKAKETIAAAEADRIARTLKSVALTFDASVGQELPDWSGARLLAEAAPRIRDAGVRVAVFSDRAKAPDYEPPRPLEELLREARAQRKPIRRLVNWGDRPLYTVVVPIVADPQGRSYAGVADGTWEPGTIPLVIAVGIDPAEFAPAKRAALYVGLAGVFALLLVLGLAYSLSESVRRSINRLAEEAGAVAEGNFDTSIGEYPGELGRVARAVERLRNSMRLRRG